jgi:N-methylhydantoinase A
MPTRRSPAARASRALACAAARPVCFGYETSTIVHGTTRATNAVATAQAARTALFCTMGHPDTLLWREGNDRRPAMDFTQSYPAPYVPRRLTFEIRERVASDGSVLVPLDEAGTRELLRQLVTLDVEAIAVALLWSIVNPRHELAVGALIEDELPGVPFTLSHALNPTLREYRRTSSAAIDASVKPLMTRYFERLEDVLQSEGFDGRLLSLTSEGGVLDAADVAVAPIHSIGSGPAAAPVAGPPRRPRRRRRAASGSDSS